MPNWCEGNIRLRGKPAAILNFIENEIMCSGYRKFPDGLETVPADNRMAALYYHSMVLARMETLRQYADILEKQYGRRPVIFLTNGFETRIDDGQYPERKVATIYSNDKSGPRYLNLTEGYITRLALDENDEIIGYQFVSLGKMTDFIKKGDDPTTAWEKAKGQYGRVADAVKIIDPRHE